MLRIHASVVTFELQTIVEQGLALLSKILRSQGRSLATSASRFPEHLRFGMSSEPELGLAFAGLRHRRAAVALGRDPDVVRASAEDPAALTRIARQRIVENRDTLLSQLGTLVIRNTEYDLAS